MIISRRTFLSLAASAAAAVATSSAATASEPFPVNKAEVDMVPLKYRRKEVKFKTSEPAGTIVIDTQPKFLYYVLGDGKAIRYGIGVGRKGTRWTGTAVIGRMAKWPKWIPTDEMLEKHANYEQWKDGMPGGEGNPLGARAMYLLNDGVDKAYRIHGTTSPKTIGEETTSGCFRMLNIDVIDLYGRAKVGTRVVVLPRVASKRSSLFGSIE